MKILAIDPGPTNAAFVVWDGERVLDKGIVPSERVLPILGTVGHECACVCEMIACYGMPVGAETFNTCVWIGRYVEKMQGQMALLTRLKVKLHLCQSARAKDGNVRQALIDRFGAPGTKGNPGALYGVSSHAWAALAVAVTHYDTLQASGMHPPL